MPVLEGFLPAPFDGYVQDLLFDLAMWHAYAKLRMHTDSTLDSFEKTTTSLGQQLRKFASKTCAAFATKETPRELAARHRRTAAKKAKAAGTSAPNEGPVEPPPLASAEPLTAKQKVYNLFTYKLHALGDYVKNIRMFGTTDSYSTQVVSHKLFITHRDKLMYDYRASLNTAESNVSMLEPTKINSLDNVLDTNDESGSFENRN
jgi:hypothetical protein